MTDRLKGFTVVLEQPLREDDAESIKNAILAIRGVLAVKPHVNGPNDIFAEQRVRHELYSKIIAVLKEGL